MRRLPLGICGLVGLVSLASCYLLDITGPATAHGGEAVSFRVSAGISSGGVAQFCVQRPSSWAAETIEYAIDGGATGTLTTLNASATTNIEASDPTAGYAWTCYDTPNTAADDKGHADVSLVAGAAGTYTLRFAVVTFYGPSIGSHNLVVDGVPRYDNNIVPTPIANAVSTIAYGNGRFVSTSIGSQVLVDIDGTLTAHGTTAPVRAIAFADGKFVAGGDNGAIISSSDGETWSSLLNGTTSGVYIQKIFRGVNRFIALGYNGTILQSPDGTTWTAAATTGLVAGTEWDHGAASADTEVIVSYEGDVVAVSHNGGAFAAITIPSDATISDVAYAQASGGWIFPRKRDFLRSAALTDFTPVSLAASDKYYLAFEAAGYVHIGAYGELYRITPDGVLAIGTQSAGQITSGADDGKRIVVTAVGPGSGGVLQTIDLPHLAPLTASLDFATVGAQKTFDVRNDGRGTLYVASITASGAATVLGCANATIAAGASCTVTVTLDDGAAPGNVTVTTNGAFVASQTFALTYSGTPAGDGDGSGETDGDADGDNAKKDDGCAAVPGTPFAALLALLALRRRRD